MSDIVQTFIDKFDTPEYLWKLRVLEQEIYDMYNQNLELYMVRLQEVVYRIILDLPHCIVDIVSMSTKQTKNSVETLPVVSEKRKLPSKKENKKAFIVCRNKKCRSTKVAITLVQTKSADEGMTSFCKCSNCGTNWTC